MRRRPLAPLALVLALAASAGCSPAEREVVVTRDQFGERWPLEVNSAVVVCAGDEAGAVLKVGMQRYALDEAARARGFPDVREVGIAGDIAPLVSVCTAVAAED